MKKSVKLLSFLLAITISVSAFAGNDETLSEKTKSYSKSYPLSASDKVSLDNSFGEMKISTWSKNEIKVDVNIVAKANTDAGAQKILDRISITDSKNGNEVVFKTHFKNEDREDRDDDNQKTSMKINYTVYLPASATLDATNQFGPMSIGDYEGSLSLVSRFGSLTAGKLSQTRKVLVAFGTASVESINNGKLSIQFSSAQINKMSGDISADFNQSHGIKISLDNSLKKFDLNNNFSTVSLDADKNLSGSFSLKTNFGQFSNKSVFSFNNADEDENRYVHMKKHYSGKAGSGNIPVTISSNFGNITIGHDLPFTLKEKHSS